MSQSLQLVKEYNTLNMNDLKLNGLYLKLNNNIDYANIHLMVIGPSGSPYVNGLYHFTIECKNYPNIAPIVYYSSNSNIVISTSINYINDNSNVNSNVLLNGNFQLPLANQYLGLSNCNINILPNTIVNPPLKLKSSVVKPSVIPPPVANIILSRNLTMNFKTDLNDNELTMNNLNGTLNLNYLKRWNNRSNLLLLLSNIKETIFVTEPFANERPVNTTGNISIILDKYYNVVPLMTTNKDFIKLFYNTSKAYLLKNRTAYYNEINALSGFDGRIVSNILIDSNIMAYNFTELINSL